MEWSVIPQIMIPVCSVFTATLITRGDKRSRKIGCLIGLLAQPFWYWTTLENSQYGVFLVAVYYTWRWVIGVRNNCD